MKNFFWLGFTGVLILSACNDNTSTSTSTNDDSANQPPMDMANHGSSTGDSSSQMGMNKADFMGIMDKNTLEMKNMQSSGNPDNDFANLMKMHHMSAIEAAQAEIAMGHDAQLKNMAQKMLDDQQKEVAEFNSFVSGHHAHGGGEAFFKESMGKMSNMKMDMNQGSTDQQFVQMMIPHHQGAIDMAKAYLKTGAQEEKMKTLAINIIASQQNEIKELQTWLDKHK